MADRYFTEEELLTPPMYRAAYSDRTAWLMAEASRLAYEKYEPTGEYLDAIEDLALESVGQALTTTAKKLKDLQDTNLETSEGLAVFKSALKAGHLELVRVFSRKGTQAFLAKNDEHKVAILAFRGTEKNLDDIKTDLDARFFRDQSNSKIHTGFLQAFQQVERQVTDALEGLNGYSIYITGHSLGGALAVVAARQLRKNHNIAACYTFGSPRVGNSEFGDPIKAPIYRIVNAADMVPRLPPSFFIDALIQIFRAAPIPYGKSWIVGFLKKFRGYSHHGDMRYLSACRSDFSDLRLISNLNVIHRAVLLYSRLLATRLKAGAADHRISEYCGKLKFYAKKRLQDS